MLELGNASEIRWWNWNFRHLDREGTGLGKVSGLVKKRKRWRRVCANEFEENAKSNKELDLGYYNFNYSWKCNSNSL